MTTAEPDLAALVAAARSGSRRALGRLFSEAERAALDPALSAALVAVLTPPPGLGASAAGQVVGFTGSPGSGKSSLLAVVSAALVDRGRRVAVLAVDPSSPISGGAVLGDRVRFTDADPAVGVARHGGGPAPGRLLVRSIASRGHAGGLAGAVPLAIAVAGGVGFDDVLVETVGSGQGEVAVAAAVDTTVLVAAPGQGDEVQAMKAGIAELADIICVTKADLPGAAESARQWRAALGPAPAGQWDRRVVLASARTADIAELLTALDARAAWCAAVRGGRAAAASMAAGTGGARDSEAGGEARRGGAGDAGDAGDAWRAAAAAAAGGGLGATIALTGAALLVTARERVGAGGSDTELLVRAGLEGAVTAADLDPGRLATAEGLVEWVATVRYRVGR